MSVQILNFPSNIWGRVDLFTDSSVLVEFTASTLRENEEDYLYCCWPVGFLDK